MLGLDFSEILIIGVVALIVVGPKELPAMMRTVGQWVAKARRLASEFQGQVNEAIREAELDDVKKQVDDLRSLSPKALVAEQFSSMTQTLDEVKRETDAQMAAIRESAAGEPALGPAPVAEPVMAETEVAAHIDAATGAPVDLGVPVFDLGPSGVGEPVAVAAEAEAPVAVEPKKVGEA